MLALRLLFLFLIFYVVFSALKSLLRGAKKKAADSGIGEAMVLDPQCQTYVPLTDALARGGKYFCSEECARLYLTR